jgi:hypothetical protein
MDLDETALKAEIDRIAVRIDDIMQKVNRFYPQQELKPTQGDKIAKSTDDKSGSP